MPIYIIAITQVRLYGIRLYVFTSESRNVQPTMSIDKHNIESRVCRKKNVTEKKSTIRVKMPTWHK